MRLHKLDLPKIARYKAESARLRTILYTGEVLKAISRAKNLPVVKNNRFGNGRVLHIFIISRLFAIVMVGVLALISSGVYAQSSSTNYKVDQTLFGSGGQLDAQSGQYRSRQTAGELAIGNTASLNYQAYAGFNTTDEPFIEFVVTANNIDLGYLSTASASTATGTFYVRSWQAGGYAVVTASDPPTNTANSSYQISPLVSPTVSSPGTEQFGINLKANTSPSIGAEAQQVPDGTFSFGTAATGYNTVNNFKYVKNDIIAQSAKSSSVTIYTISYLFNINNLTPSGEYRFNHVLVATGTY